jgi:hypothetical protein
MNTASRASREWEAELAKIEDQIRRNIRWGRRAASLRRPVGTGTGDATG